MTISSSPVTLLLHANLLEKNLEAMKQEWAEIEFDVKAYKETGTSIVGGIDEIINEIEKSNKGHIKNLYLRRILYII